MKEIYNKEFTKALAAMISRGDFDRDIDRDYGWWEHKLKSTDLDEFLEHIDLNKNLHMNLVELEMLTGTLENTSFIKHYNKKESLKIHEITSIDFLLYSSIKIRLFSKNY